LEKSKFYEFLHYNGIMKKYYNDIFRDKRNIILTRLNFVVKKSLESFLENHVDDFDIKFKRRSKFYFKLFKDKENQALNTLNMKPSHNLNEFTKDFIDKKLKNRDYKLNYLENRRVNTQANARRVNTEANAGANVGEHKKQQSYDTKIPYLLIKNEFEHSKKKNSKNNYKHTHINEPKEKTQTEPNEKHSNKTDKMKMIPK